MFQLYLQQCSEVRQSSPVLHSQVECWITLPRRECSSLLSPLISLLGIQTVGWQLHSDAQFTGLHLSSMIFLGFHPSGLKTLFVALKEIYLSIKICWLDRLIIFRHAGDMAAQLSIFFLVETYK